MLPRAPAGVDSEYRSRSSIDDCHCRGTSQHQILSAKTASSETLGFPSRTFPAGPVDPYFFALSAFDEYRLPAR